jgi:toxin ParE1/3/4
VRVRVTARADRELAAMIRWGAEHFGTDTAIEYYRGVMRVFELLASTPRMAPEIRDGMRAHPYRSHIIVYRQTADRLEVLHIRHGRSNWRKYL